LESQGYQVATAEDGEKALVHIKKELPDLILLDIMLPKVHGLNILDIIKSTSKARE
jgi:DNA-binding response OmpR family regulator